MTPVRSDRLFHCARCGEQRQVCRRCDHGQRYCPGACAAARPLMGFVMVLSYSRPIFVRFYPGAEMARFVGGHVGAFQAFAGVPRVLLYDNLRRAVLERVGQAIHFHPTLIVTADTTLTEDHDGNVVLDADGVTLDCNGRTVTGADAGIGILLVERNGVTVQESD